MSAFDRVVALLFEPSTSLLIVYVILLQVLSCYRSQSFALNVHEQVAHEAETSSLNIYAAVALPVIGSVMLMVLFFFLNIMFYFLVLLFGVSALGAMMMFAYPSVRAMRVSMFPRISEVQSFRCRGKTHSIAVFDTAVCMIVAASTFSSLLKSVFVFSFGFFLPRKVVSLVG